MKKIIQALLLIIFCNSTSASPNEFGLTNSLSKKNKKTSGFDKTRLLLGPGIGAGTAYRAFSINIAPTVGYAFHENFNAGATLAFNYFQQSGDLIFYDNNQSPPAVYNVPHKLKIPGYTFSVYARYLVKNFLMLNFEPELNNVKFVSDFNYNPSTNKVTEIKQRITIPSVLIGVGYMQRFGQYSYSFISLNYDLVQNPNSRYYQTFDYRFGVMIQLFN